MIFPKIYKSNKPFLYNMIHTKL